MDCYELILNQDVFDFIIENNPRVFPFEDVDLTNACIVNVDSNWSIGYGKFSDKELSVSRIGYSTIPKLYGLMDTTSMQDSGILQTINQPYISVKGQNVIIGFIDTGIDYLHEAFKLSSTNSRISIIWDQTVQTFENERVAGENRLKESLTTDFNYGTFYQKEDINRAIEAYNKGENPYDYVPSVDYNGHGTAVAGVAAGSTLENFTGAAPMSEIAMVKLKPAKQYLRDYYLINESADAYEETDIMMGIRFLLDYADYRGLPLVICFSLGTGQGPRNGSMPLASMLQQASRNSNVVVVTCMGNEAAQRTHAKGRAISVTEPSVVEINVGENERGFTSEIWVSGQDVLSVSIISPSGEEIPRIPARITYENEYGFLLENTRITVNYRVVESLTGNQLIFMRFQDPAPGIWRVRIFGLTDISGEYNMWLPIRQFLTGDTFIINSNADVTLTDPAGAERIISVGAYNHLTGASDIASGRGFNSEGFVKPDIVAPGVNVYCPLAGGGFGYVSGSSIAAAHVAGASALLLCWGVFYGNYRLISTSDVKYILIRGADRSDRREYPNNIFGYGKLDLINSFYQLRIT